MLNLTSLQKVADAVLYEGYLLYPYHDGALKNQQRWLFGCLLPEAWGKTFGETSWVQTECLLTARENARLIVRGRFLHWDDEEISAEDIETPVLSVADLLDTPFQVDRELAQGSIRARLQVAATLIEDRIYRIRVRLENTTNTSVPAPPTRDGALKRGLLSCSALLGLENGTFFSSIDPPERVREAASQCRNIGLWPVLAGDPVVPQFVLAASIILYDFPQVAGASRIETFDATEIDEILRLRLLTLTAEEQEAVRRTDSRSRQVLAEAHSLTETEALALHGTCRPGVQAGSRVRLRPRPGADVLDLALAGQSAVVVSVDEDLEGRLHLGVILDDDPGRDLGLAGWPGHRFYFSVDEVELLP